MYLSIKSIANPTYKHVSETIQSLHSQSQNGVILAVTCKGQQHMGECFKNTSLNSV